MTIDVRAANINPIDYKLYSGAFGSDGSQLPMRLGMEASGVVSAAGADAQGPSGTVSVGDEVIVFGVDGGYADQVTAPASGVYPKPPNLSWEQGAGLIADGRHGVPPVGGHRRDVRRHRPHPRSLGRRRPSGGPARGPAWRQGHRHGQQEPA
ncbi:MAG: alcohol dehydrogenase catalytic domain-containing protein [Geodermatophilaceae bacterium]